jgi:uncharacterized membrane protein YqjE
MALIQAVLALIGRSLGKVLTALFGWAVVALFGRTSERDRLLLSGVVALAVAWPLLIAGIAWPRVAAWLIAFVPLSERAPKGLLRALWLALALAVPLVVGAALARWRASSAPREGTALRLLRGFPLTVAIAASFLLMLLTVPTLHLASAARGRRAEHVTCVGPGVYATIAAQLDEIVARYGFRVARAEPAWWLAAPAAILRGLGGRRLETLLPEHLAYWKGAELELALYPSDVLVRGAEGRVAWIHGVLVEELARGPGLQSGEPHSQDLERQLQRVWSVLDEDPAAHRDSSALRARLRDLVEALASLEVDYDSWEVVYRQALQLGRALDGQAQLLGGRVARAREGPVAAASAAPARVALSAKPAAVQSLAEAPTADLLAGFVRDTGALLEKQVELARAELREEKSQLLRAIKGLVVAGIAGVCAIELLLVTGVLALSHRMSAWLAALLVAAAALLIAVISGIIAWTTNVRHPFDKTRQTLTENARWLKERTA